MLNELNIPSTFILPKEQKDTYKNVPKWAYLFFLLDEDNQIFISWMR